MHRSGSKLPSPINRTCSHPAWVLLPPSSQATHVRLPSETVQFVGRSVALKSEVAMGKTLRLWTGQEKWGTLFKMNLLIFPFRLIFFNSPRRSLDSLQTIQLPDILRYSHSILGDPTPNYELCVCGSQSAPPRREANNTRRIHLAC